MKYTREIEKLSTGSALGNFLLFARFDPESNLEGLWHSLDNRFYCGRWRIEFYTEEKLNPTETNFEMLSQETRYENISGDLVVTKKAFVPYVQIENLERCEKYLKKFFYILKVENKTDRSVELVIIHNITLPAVDSQFFTKQPPVEEKYKKFKVSESDGVLEIETIGSDEERHFLTSNFKFAKTYFDGNKIKCMQRINVGGNETVELLLLYSLGEKIKGDELKNLYDEIYNLSTVEINEVLNRTYIFTPSKVINSGIQWAKVNMCRVENLYKNGFAFTNDPPGDIAVMRDIAWFVLGSDYVTPKFSHEMIEFALKYGIHPDGKVTEYVHAGEFNPKLYDYNLNINDDTPLFIWALYHHANLCDLNELSVNYDVIKKIADYILMQVKDGLVFSSANGVGVYGITGWRNIIENYNLSGYVTEINSECIYALELVSKIAEYVCNKQDALKYKNYADRLRENFYKKLISEVTELPVLNIDQNGVKHHDITGDLVFPLLFGIFDNEIEFKIAKRLIEPDLWTKHGARTVSKFEKNYDPDFGYQLMGGIWPNLTAWIGFGIRKFFPEKVAEAMENIYRVIEAEDPSYFQNLVPGQFPERFDGENFKSRGMSLSPWMPPTYVWLAVEGLCGFYFEFEKIKIKPSLPSDWKWVGVKNLPYRDSLIDAFIFDGKLYISGIEMAKIEFDGEIIEIEKLSNGIESTGTGQIYHFTFRILKTGDKCIFIGSDIGFEGEIKVGSKNFKIKLNPGDGIILGL